LEEYVDTLIDEELNKLEVELRKVLERDNNDNDITFDGILGWLRQILDRVRVENDIDVVVFLDRKAWVLYNIFRPFLLNHYLGKGVDYKNSIESKVTHDSMFPIWLNANANDKKPSELKVAVVDDSSVHGESLGRAVARFHNDLGVGFASVSDSNGKAENHNISVYAYIAADNEDNKKRIREGKYLTLGKDGEEIEVLLGSGKGSWPYWRSVKEVRNFSKRIVECLSVSSIPYVAFSRGFVFELKDTVSILGNLEDVSGDYIRQNNLNEPFSDPSKFEFYNNTCVPFYDNNVESFVLFPKEESGVFFDYLPNSKDIVKCLRVYVNRPMSKLMILPYVDMRFIDKEVKIEDFFPEKMSRLFNEFESRDKKEKYRAKLAGSKLISFVLGYTWGKDFIDRYFSATNCSVVSMIGLHSVKKFGNLFSAGNDSKLLFDWLNDRKAVKEKLKDMSAHFIREYPTNEEGLDEATQRVFDNCFPSERIDRLSERLGIFFREILYNKKRNEVSGNDSWKGKGVEYGISIQLLVEKLKERYVISTEKIYSAVLSVLDAGMANLVFHNEKDFGDNKNNTGRAVRCLIPGEQSCNAVYYANPSYGSFLQKLVDVGVQKDKHKEIIKKTRQHFRDLGKSENETIMLINALLSAIDSKETKLDSEPSPVYCTDSRQIRIDFSCFFFWELTEECLLT